MNERSYVNGYVDDETRSFVLLYRDEKRELRQFRRPNEWVAYFLKDDGIDGSPTIGETQMRDMRRWQSVSSIAEEGNYYRIGFRSREFRDKACFGTRDVSTGEIYDSVFKEAGIQVFEADLDPIRRFFSDTGANIERPHRCYLDIETDSRSTIQAVKDGFARVLCWTVVSQDNTRTVHDVLQEDSDEDEERLLRHLWKTLEDFDHVVAWMSPMADEFDFVVIQKRSQQIGIHVDTRRWVWLDQLKVYKKMNMQSAETGEEKRSFKLQNIAMAELGEGKDDFDARKTWEAWAAGGAERLRMQKYNIKDAKLLFQIEAKTGYIELFVTVCEVCRIFPSSRSLAPIQQMDGFLLRLAYERGQHFASRDPYKKEDDGDKFAGAWVMEPARKGILKDVHVCDFASLYPSIMLTFNMSPDTKRGKSRLVFRDPNDVDGEYEPTPPNCCRAPTTKIVFSTEKEGILVGALKTILAMRAEWDKKKSACPPGTPEWHDADRRSKALKVLANSFYGLLGNTYSRFHDEEIAESVTQTGVWLLKLTLKEAEERFKMFAVYGDTDSGFVMDTSVEAFSAFVDHMNKNVYPKVLAAEGCKDNHIKLAYEKAFSRLIFLSAKRYCNPPEAPIWMADGSFKKLGEIEVGDRVMGWARGQRTSNPDPSVRRRKLAVSEVVAVTKRRAPIVKVTMTSGRTIRCTADHRWLTAGGRQHSEFITPKVGRFLIHVIDQPRALTSREKQTASWLGGIWDGEGSLAGLPRSQIAITQSPIINPEVCTRIELSLKELGFDYGIYRNTGSCNNFVIRGGKQERLNFMTWCEPAKSEKIRQTLINARVLNEEDCISSIEPDGDGEVIALTTTTGNYVAWGYASKNCGSYLHYKGKAATKDSKPEIKGLEYKRGDANLVARRLQAEMIDMLVGGLKVSEHGAPTEKIEDYHVVLERARSHILHDTLSIEEVRMSKSLSKGLNAYPKDGAPVHVRVARDLKEKGYAIGKGQRVEYIITDGEASPMVAMSADEYTGEHVDRYYLWENLIYPPTERLLQSAFPDHDWKIWEKVRPVKRKKASVRRKLIVSDKQTAMFAPEVIQPAKIINGVPLVAEQSDTSANDYLIRVDERRVLQGLGAINAILRKHEGSRRAVYLVHYTNGSTSRLESNFMVDGSMTLHNELAPFRPAHLRIADRAIRET